jgi:hypothetical protein
MIVKTSLRITQYAISLMGSTVPSLSLQLVFLAFSLFSVRKLQSFVELPPRRRRCRRRHRHRKR